LKLNQDEKPRHLALYAFTPELLIGMCQNTKKTTTQVTANAIPEDAEIVRCNYNSPMNRFEILVEHPSFPMVRPGDVVPWAEAPTFTQFWDEVVTRAVEVRAA